MSINFSFRQLLLLVPLLAFLLLPLIAVGADDTASHSHAADTHNTEHQHHEEVHGSHADEPHHGHHGVEGAKLPLWWVIPFVGILLSIAVFPLVAEHFWHHNYGKVSLAWIVIFSIPFLLGYKGDAWYEIVHIVLLDYVPFIILLTALFTAAGGICVKGSLRGSPAVNTLILAIGTSLASWMGPTGAAMLLIRPL